MRTAPLRFNLRHSKRAEPIAIHRSQQPLSFISSFGVTVSIAAIYALMGMLGLQLAIDPGNVTAVWPPSGFALAAMLLFGRKAWLGIGLGAFAINSQAFVDASSLESIAVSTAVGIGIGIGSVAQPVLGALLIRRFIKSGGLTSKVRNFLVFVSVVPTMCLVSSTIGTTSLLLGGFATAERLSELWVTWWLGDGVGILIVTPFLLAYYYGSALSWNVRKALEQAAAFSLLTLSGLISFGAISEGGGPYPLEFLTLPFLLWLALRFSERALTTGILLLAGIAIWQTVGGKGVFQLDSPNISLLLLQLFLSVSAITVMVIAALTNERRDAETALQNAHDELEQKIDKRTAQLQDEIKGRAHLELQLLQAQKMESLGILAGGVAHDFNNLLMPIVGYVDLIKNRISNDPVTSDYLDSIQLSGEKLTNLCTQMLIYSGGGHFVKTVIDLGEQVADMQNLVRAAIPSSFLITYHIDDRLPAVKADATQFNQVLMNLLINAGEAMKPNEGGTITVSTGQAYLDGNPESALHFDHSLEPGNYVYVEIQDEGAGISEENQSRLFDPFFTTKFTGRGLGMAVVFGVVKAHMGAVEIRSEMGAGTKIRAYFPATEDALTGTRNTKQTKLSETATLSGRILVVDDEPDVRTLMRRMLQKMGFDVIEAENGAKGLEIFCEQKHEIRACVLDLTMPGMDGLKLLSRIREVSAHVPVLLVSGHSQEQVPYNSQDSSHVSFLHKPFTFASLERAIQEQIAGSLESTDSSSVH